MSRGRVNVSKQFSKNKQSFKKWGQPLDEGNDKSNGESYGIKGSYLLKEIHSYEKSTG